MMTMAKTSVENSMHETSFDQEKRYRSIFSQPLKVKFQKKYFDSRKSDMMLWINRRTSFYALSYLRFVFKYRI